MGRPVPLDELVLDHPVDLPRDGVKVPCPDRVQRPLPQFQDARAVRVRAAFAGEVPCPGQVLALDVERAGLPAVRQPQQAPPGDVVADLADGLDRAGQGQRRRRGARFGHAQHQAGGACLEQHGGLAHGRVADCHPQPPQPCGARLVPGSDERPGPGGRGRQAGSGEPGRPAEAVYGTVRRLQHSARAADELPGDQERDQDVGQPAELAAPGDQVVLLAAV